MPGGPLDAYIFLLNLATRDLEYRILPITRSPSKRVRGLEKVDTEVC